MSIKEETEIDWFSGAPLGQLVFDRTYSRSKEDGSKETWYDLVAHRVVDGNLAFVDPQFIEEGEREKLIDLMLRRIMLPAGRHLWVTGIDGRQFISNCFVAGFTTLSDHVGFMFDLLMQGAGIGANYSTRYIEHLDPMATKVEVKFICRPDHEDYESFADMLSEYKDPNLIVEDTREGWVEALQKLVVVSQVGRVNSITFDVSNVRCSGSPIRGFGGTAAGPLPLMILLQKVSELTGTNELTPKMLMEIDHYIAEAVIAGNVRRSARMSILHWRDPQIDWFLNCKSLDPTLHWSTNISVEIDQDFLDDIRWNENSEAYRVYQAVIDGMLANGEPGFFNSQLASIGENVKVRSTNPCGEIALENWEPCNLGSVNLAYGTDDEHEEAFRLMTRFLIRATFSDYTEALTREVVGRNRRIGVGFMGLAEWLAGRRIKMSDFDNKDGVLEFYLKDWRNTVREEANKYAAQLGIPAPIKITAIAPTGTIAKLAGTSEGLQAPYAKYYIRRVRYSATDPEVARLKEEGIPLEDCIYSANTVVASFPCRDAMLDRVPEEYVEEQSEIPIERLLALQALIQKHYADNAISMTINVPEDADIRGELEEHLKEYLPLIKGTTIFPSGSRPQSPIEKLTKEEYEKLVSVEIHSGESEQLLEDCVGGACPVR